MLKVRAAALPDADQLASRLREADVREIRAASGEKPLTALRRCIVESQMAFTVLNRAGAVVSVFGVVPDPDGHGETGIVWLLGSPDLVCRPFPFLRLCRLWIDQLHRHYRILWNYVDARNGAHIRWLKWSGFMFLQLIEQHGFENRPFWEFRSIRRDSGSLETGAAKTVLEEKVSY